MAKRNSEILEISPGVRLSQYLESRCLSQSELSDLSGVDPTVISRHVKHGANLRTDTATAIAKACGISMDWWFGVRDECDGVPARKRGK